jgi:GT2 family glycosyltransferase
VKLGVVIVNWNSRDDLAACLESLQTQTHRDLEVVVVDNGSSDGSADMVRQRFPESVLLAETENLGFAEACNRGIALTTTEWVAMLNNDATADPRWAEALSSAASAAPPDCGILQSVLVFMERADTINSTGIDLTRYGGGKDRREGSRYPQTLPDEEIFCATAGAAAYRRSMLEDLKLPSGYFDRRHFMYYEDLDLGWRARLHGFRARLVPASVVHHRYHGSTARRSAEWLEILSKTNRLRTLLKNASVPFIVRTLQYTVEDLGRIVLLGGFKAAVEVSRAMGESLRDRSLVTQMAVEDRRAVERRWVTD